MSEIKSRTLEDLAAEGRFVSQLALVREHWASVRRLFLNDSDLDPGADTRSNLPPEFWLGCGMPGLAPVKPTRDGHFEFAEDGTAALIVPIYDIDPWLLDANAERHVDHLIDLVAVDLNEPGRFWCRRGEALILGSIYLDIAGQEDEPVPVFSNPISWLRAGGEGIVVLDWAWAPDLLLGFELVAEDLELGEWLDNAMRADIWIMDPAA